MKQHHSIFLPAASLACALILMLAACTSDTLDELSPIDPGTSPDARPLTITVSDGGMYATGQTRATERGYQTVFTEGDRIGLYVVKDGILQVKNLCLTLQEGKWTLPAGASQLIYSPDKSFHAYYPYKDDSYMNNKVSPGDEDFFKNLVNDWSVKSNQRTYADYTASDLMTARGVYADQTLSFAMEHRMFLLVFRFPATKYNYTEKIDGKDIPKSYYGYTACGTSLLHENPSTGRYLLDPQNVRFTSLNIVYNSGGQIKTSSIKPAELNLQSGRYTLIPIDSGVVTEETRPLQAGDFYMKDGGVLPQEDVNGAMSNKEKVDCLGVVFWVGEIEEIHWTQTGGKKGDQLLMRNHPECVHGMVVAMHDASQGAARATGKGATESIYDWAKSFSGFTPGEQADWKEMYRSSLLYGYCASRLMALYGSRHSDTTFPALDAIATYAATRPAPAGSSGWFLPNFNELTTLCFGAPANFGLSTYPYFYKNLLMLNKINPQIDKAAGTKLIGKYWSSNDSSTNAWHVNLDIPNYGAKPKTDTYKVRAVLAF